jgi:hypothetical protein
MSKLSRSKLDPGTMKELDPSRDLEQTILETFDEMHAEARSRQISENNTWPGV